MTDSTEPSMSGSGSGSGPILSRGQARSLAATIALGRTALGITCMAVPQLAPLPGDTSEGTLGFVVRIAGVRDLVLGVGALRALAAGDPSARQWVAAGGLADAGDVLMAIRSRGGLGKATAWMTVALAGGSAVASAAAYAGLSGEPDSA